MQIIRSSIESPTILISKETENYTLLICSYFIGKHRVMNWMSKN